ncbi:hypothetical protein BLNAU_17388 [Blattamonas nauphoetae]|uniref:Uncharacterized protein n=1 Tax=Blattamonas nauphoetae TaxID=2049346 RepID=A0ABQ9XBH9_9EUKA|nr:hypothetical protein BLNAU_17388 [Blattamonas nauphoetae]
MVDYSFFHRNSEISPSTIFSSKRASLKPSLDTILSQGKDNQVQIPNQSSSAVRGEEDVRPDPLVNPQEGTTVCICIHLANMKYFKPTESTQNIAIQFL